MRSVLPNTVVILGKTPTGRSCKRLFSLSRCKSARGYHPPLVNVEATDTDKRGELALSSLSEHLSGESKVGFNKSAALALNSLDKRELLSLWITLWITYPQAALRVNTLCV